MLVTSLLILATITTQTTLGSWLQDDAIARNIGVYERVTTSDDLGDLRALIIGIDQYESAEELRPLGYAETDVRDVRAELELAGFRVRMLIPGAASASPLDAETVLDEVSRIAAGATPRSVLVFYFSGHGFSGRDGRPYICAVKSDPTQLERTAVPLNEVAHRLKSSAANKVAIIIDACRNTPTRSVSAEERMLLEFADDEGSGFLFSTRPGGLSFEPTPGLRDGMGREIKNGLFTHFFLWGLRGEAEQRQDDVITFLECALYTDTQLQTTPLPAGLRQRPWLLWDGGTQDDIPLRVLARGPRLSRTQDGSIPTVTSQSNEDDAATYAQVAEANSDIENEIGSEVDRVDWYKLWVDEPGTMVVSLKNRSAEKGPANVIGVEIKTQDLATIAEMDYRGVPAGTEKGLNPRSISVEDHRKYFLRVHAAANTPVMPYTLSIRFSPLVYADREEPNDHWEHAAVLKPNGSVTALVGIRHDALDLYQIPIESDGTLTLAIENLHANGVGHGKLSPVNLMDADQVSLDTTDYRGLSPTERKTIGPITVSAGASYYVAISEADTHSSAPYRLTSVFESSAMADAGEPNDARSRAETLPLDTSIDRTIGYGDDQVDWIMVTAPTHGLMRVTFSNQHKQPIKKGKLAPLVMLSSFEELLHTFGSRGLGPTQAETSPFIPVSAGAKYYLRVSAADEVDAAPYQLQTQFRPLDITEDIDAGNDATSATPLLLNDMHEATIGYGKDFVDVYRLDLPNDGELRVTVTNLHPGKVDPQLGRIEPAVVVDAASKRVTATDHRGIAPGNASSSPIVRLPAGTYFLAISVKNRNCGAPYRLEVVHE